jgi:probable phosphoglycerate mutase
MNMIKLILIRHGLNDLVGKRIASQMAGVHLNDEGKQQAQELADNLSTMQIDAIYCSPLERAVETAIPLAKSHKLDYTISKDFMEIDFGIWTNKSLEDLEKEELFKIFNIFRSNTRAPGGELMAEAQLRIIQGIEKLQRQHNNETVAVVSHSDLIKCAIMYYLGMNLDNFHRFEISPASISIIEIYDEIARVMVLNKTFY